MDEKVTQKIEVKTNMNSKVRFLTLNDKEHKDTILYRLEKNWILEFRLGPTLLGRKIFLFCNYPQNNQPFERNKYYQLSWIQDEGCKYSDDTALLVQIILQVSGGFHYYFTYGST